MKALNKLINFFTSTYYDNIKYKHSTASLLKIFFERANKTTQTVASLGNVYRNSKWSDLKVQNIKTTHIKGFTLSLLLFVASALVAYFLLFRVDNSTTNTFIKPLTLLWSYLVDWTIYLVAVISLSFYYLQFKITFYMSKLYSSAFGSYANTSSSINLNLPSYSPEATNVRHNLSVNFSPNYVNLKGADSLVRQAYKVSDILVELDHPTIKLSKTNFLFQNTNRVVSAYLDVASDKSNSAQGFRSFSLSSLESNFLSRVSSPVNASAHKLRLDGNTLASSNKDKDLHNILNHSIEQNLSVGKQTRWLLRSLPISEYLSNSNFTYSQAKVLVGNPSFNSSISSKNIWASSKANDLLTSNTLNLGEALTNNSVNNNSIINFFEDSRSFLNKKAYFTLQPRLNTTSLAPSFQSNQNLYSDSSSLVNMSEVLLLDMNILLLGNTLSSGSLFDGDAFNAPASSSSLFLTNDYLSYFVGSHDNFVISLNSTNANNTLNLNFFNASSFNTCPANIKL